MYRDDDIARTDRAHALITEIGALERQRVDAAQTEVKLAAARDELRGLQGAPPVLERPASFAHHFLVFAATAGATWTLYTVLIAG